MIAVYSPTSIAQELRVDLESALDRDEARITFVGTDGKEEYVIVEALQFHHATILEKERQTKLLFPLIQREV